MSSQNDISENGVRAKRKRTIYGASAIQSNFENIIDEYNDHVFATLLETDFELHWNSYTFPEDLKPDSVWDRKPARAPDFLDSDCVDWEDDNFRHEEAELQDYYSDTCTEVGGDELEFDWDAFFSQDEEILAWDLDADLLSPNNNSGNEVNSVDPFEISLGHVMNETNTICYGMVNLIQSTPGCA